MINIKARMKAVVNQNEYFWTSSSNDFLGLLRIKPTTFILNICIFSAYDYNGY